MQRRLNRLTAEVTALLLAASALLVGASLLGAGGSLPLALAFAVGALALFAGREAFPTVGPVAGHDVDAYLRNLWAAPAVAAATTLALLGAIPGEIQAAGGVFGLLAMANYFLRPFYHLVASLGAWARERVAA